MACQLRIRAMDLAPSEHKCLAQFFWPCFIDFSSFRKMRRVSSILMFSDCFISTEPDVRQNILHLQEKREGMENIAKIWRWSFFSPVNLLKVEERNITLEVMQLGFSVSLSLVRAAMVVKKS